MDGYYVQVFVSDAYTHTQQHTLRHLLCCLSLQVLTFIDVLDAVLLSQYNIKSVKCWYRTGVVDISAAPKNDIQCVINLPEDRSSKYFCHN